MKLRTVRDYAVITLGAILAAVGIYFFMLPSHLVVGSGTAIAMVLSNFIPLQISVLSLLLNVILLILGFLLVGQEFGARTVYAAVLIPATLGVLEVVFPDQPSLTQDPLMDMICYILIVGMAMAILFSRNASSGGIDIIAKILSKYLHIGIGVAVSAAGLAVALTSAFFYDTQTIVLSVLGTYFSGMVVDRFIFGLNIKRRVCIISTKVDEIVDYLLNELHSGATLYDGIGAYNHAVHREIVTIVDKQEYRLLMDHVRRVDPAAFVTVISVNEMRYLPKSEKRS